MLSTFMVEAKIKPSTFQPVSPTLYQLSYPARQMMIMMMMTPNKLMILLPQ
jgi:hypothetical protein